VSEKMDFKERLSMNLQIKGMTINSLLLSLEGFFSWSLGENVEQNEEQTL